MHQEPHRREHSTETRDESQGQGTDPEIAQYRGGKWRVTRRRDGRNAGELGSSPARTCLQSELYITAEEYVLVQSNATLDGGEVRFGSAAEGEGELHQSAARPCWRRLVQPNVTDSKLSETSNVNTGAALLSLPQNPINDLTAFAMNEPKFTLEELRQVLWERNDLKTKLMEVEEELRLFKEQ